MNYDFSPERLSIALDMLKNDMPYALWETLYATVLATLFAVIIGLPLGILLAVGGKDGIIRVPKWVLSLLGVLINLLRFGSVHHSYGDSDPRLQGLSSARRSEPKHRSFRL